MKTDYEIGQEVTVLDIDGIKKKFRNKTITVVDQDEHSVRSIDDNGVSYSTLKTFVYDSPEDKSEKLKHNLLIDIMITIDKLENELNALKKKIDLVL